MTAGTAQGGRDGSGPEARRGTEEVQRWVTTALEATDAAREALRAILRGGLRAQRKPDGTWVTDADRAVEAAVREVLRHRHPDEGIVGEELPPENKGARRVWYVDPVDGTEDLILGSPLYGVIVALHGADGPLVGVIDHPALEVRVVAGRGAGLRIEGAVPTSRRPREAGTVVAIPAMEDFVRAGAAPEVYAHLCRAFENFRVYRTCYAHTLVVLGGLDAALEYGVSPWDLAASRVLVEESGRTYVPLTVPPGAHPGRRAAASFGDADPAGRIASVVERAASPASGKGRP